jgi:N-acetylmuramoyl-L-alanine amidase
VNIKLYANDPIYFVDGDRRHLKSAPFEKSSQFWLPLQFILRLGLVIKDQNQNQLSLDWDKKYLLDIENITYQNRPAFLFIGTGELKMNDISIGATPKHLVLEFPSTKAYFSLDARNKTNSVVKKLHLEQGENSLKLMFDLNQSIGYKLIHDPNQPNQFILVFNYFIKEINLQQINDVQQILIKSSLPATYQVQVATTDQLVIDFEGATLTTGDQLITGDGKWVNTIKMIQLDSQTVRVEIALLNSDPYFVIRASDNANLIEIRTTQLMQQMNWIDTESGGKLTIVTNGELVAIIQKILNPAKLVIELKYLQLAPQFTQPLIKNNMIKDVRVVTVDSATVRIEIDPEKLIDYNTEISADRRYLTLYFRHSPLVGKTIELDPGHGGEDLGACGRLGTQEKDNNLEIAMHLKELLEQAGAAVVLTRTDDYFVGLYERAFLANYLLADLFVSIHTNNHPDLNIHGIELYYFPGHNEAKELAQDVLDKLAQNTGLVGLGVKQDDFVVIRETQMPGILVETGFLSNFQEENTIRTPEFKNNTAMGIFQGIMDYYRK